MQTFCCCDQTDPGSPNLTAVKNAGDPIGDDDPLLVATKTDGMAAPPDAAVLNVAKNVTLLTDADSDGTISVGDTISFSVPVCNNGTVPATNVTFTDPAPAGLSFVTNSATTTIGSVTTSTASMVMVSIGTLAPGQCATVVFQATVTAAQTITNEATASSPDADTVDDTGEVTFSSNPAVGSCAPGCVLTVNWPTCPIVNSATITATTAGCVNEGLVKFYLDGVVVEQDQPSNAAHTFGPGFDGAADGDHDIRVCIEDANGADLCCDEITCYFGEVTSTCAACAPTTDLTEPCNLTVPTTWSVDSSACSAADVGLITWYLDGNVVGNSQFLTIDPSIFADGQHTIRVLVVGAGVCLGETLLDKSVTCTFGDTPPPQGLILCDSGCEPGVGEDMHTRIINKFSNASWGHPNDPTNTSHGTNCSIHVTHQGGCQSCSGCNSLGGVGTERIYFTPQTGNAGGCGSNCNIEYDHLFFRAYVFYANSFNPVLGGKMPIGLAGGNGKSGGGQANGCEGWSGRVSFDNNDPNNSNCMAMNYYMYGSMQTGYYGRKYPWVVNGNQYPLCKGVWNCIEGEYKMNDIGSSNGILRGWINGQQAVSVTNVQYRTCPGLGIDHWFFSSFYGGCGNQYAPNNDTHAWFDDFAVSTSRINCDYQAGCQ